MTINRTPRLAFITGATSGIGEALAKFLASQKIELILTGRNQEKLDQLKQELSATTIQADLSKASEREKLKTVIQDRKPDLIVNNAGFGLYGIATDISHDEQIEMIRTNVEALVDLTLCGGEMMKQEQIPGVIMNISSSACFQPLAYFATYAATKSFVTSFSEAVNYELKPSNIAVLSSCPGQVKTDFSNRASKGKGSPKKSYEVMSVDFAVKEIWEQIQSRQPVRAFDWKYRFAKFFSLYIAPRFVTFKVMESVMKNRWMKK